jgi:O-methyltransferase
MFEGHTGRLRVATPATPGPPEIPGDLVALLQQPSGLASACSKPAARSRRSNSIPRGRRPKLAGEFDFVFLDAWRRDYKRFFDLVFPRLRPGGLFLAHNVVNKAGEMRDFLAAVQNNPAVMTTIVRPGNEGMSITYRLEVRR